MAQPHMPLDAPQNDAEYDRLLARFNSLWDRLWDNATATEAEQELNDLAAILEAYEKSRGWQNF